MASDGFIKESLLRELMSTSVHMTAVVRGEKQGFSVSVTVSGKQRVLNTARGQARLFASLDTAASFVNDIGMPQFEVDMSGYQKGRLRSPRPDRAAALKKTRTRLKQQVLGI